MNHHAEEIEAAINAAVVAIPANRVSIEVTGDTADMLVALAHSVGWTMGETTAYLFDQVAQMFERGLAIHEDAEVPNTAGYDVRAATWPTDLKQGDLVMDGDNDPGIVVGLRFDETAIIVDVVGDWSTTKDGELETWDADDVMSWQLVTVVKLSEEDARRYKLLGQPGNDDDADAFIEDLRTKHVDR